MLRCNGGIILNEQLDELYSGFDEDEEDLQEISEEDLQEFFGIETDDSSSFDDLSEDEKYFLKLCKDRQRG